MLASVHANACAMNGVGNRQRCAMGCKPRLQSNPDAPDEDEDMAISPDLPVVMIMAQHLQEAGGTRLDLPAWAAQEGVHSRDQRRTQD